MKELPRERERQQAPRERSRAKPRANERSNSRDRAHVRPAVKETEAEAKRPKSLEMEEAIATAGADGALNIMIDMFWEEVEGHRPAGFTVTTLPNNGLEVVLEQLSYRRTYSGTGTVTTALTPIAPIGTTGRLVATDTTTGETKEQPWTWYRLGGGGLGLWQMIKRLIFK